MEERAPRKRIPVSRNLQAAIVDPMEFKKNKSSDHARIVTSINEKIEIELWFDKHYVDRHQHGDDKGKREGIENSVVEALVLQSVKHLLFYSACLKNFSFVNYDVVCKIDRAVRVVCQQSMDGGMLNAVIEVHYKSLGKYEITVKTAMRYDDFKIGDGQYAIEILDKDNSVLKFMSKNKLNEVCSI